MGQTLYVVLFQLGALQPELSTKSFMPKIESVAETSINNLINPLTRIFESGQNLSRNNPTLGNFVAHFISYIYVAFWLSILSYAFFGVFRYLIHSIYVFLKEKRTLK